MRLAGIEDNSIVDGPGIRMAIFISGCNHHCKNCHNPQTWDFNYGRLFDEGVQLEVFDQIESNDLLDGITLTGGDPFYSSKELIPFVKEFKSRFPNKDIWAYTGFTWEDLIKDSSRKELASLCDVVVDGPFLIEKKDYSQSFRGSFNQRFIDAKASLEKGEVVEIEEDNYYD